MTKDLRSLGFVLFASRPSLSLILFAVVGEVYEPSYIHSDSGVKALTGEGPDERRPSSVRLLIVVGKFQQTSAERNQSPWPTTHGQ